MNSLLRAQNFSSCKYRRSYWLNTSQIYFIKLFKKLSMSQAPNISIISHFYNAHSCVNEQIAHWQQINPQLNELFEFILVDDFSDADYVLPKTDLNIRLFRVMDDIPWNQGGARNLATFHARGEVALFIDIDQHIKIDFLERLCLSAK